MSNQTIRIERQSIILNNKKGNLVTTYHLKPGNIGDFAWHKVSVTFEKTNDNSKTEERYLISDKEFVRLNGVMVTVFKVFKMYDDAYIYVGTYRVPSRGVARDATCLKAWLNREY